MVDEIAPFSFPLFISVEEDDSDEIEKLADVEIVRELDLPPEEK